MQNHPVRIALKDISNSMKRLSLVGMLGWQDVLQRYRRSALGPFWLTISMGIMIGTIGLVFGQIFSSPMREFLPFLSIGLILWNSFSLIVIEGCSGLTSSEAIIRQLPIPIFVHILRLIWRNLLIFGHNIVIFPLVLLIVGKPLTWVALLSIPGLLLMCFNLAWIALLLSIICARYRDLSQIVTSLLQVVFYLTPIIWMPSQMPKRAGLYLLDFNPLYHLIEIVRSPLMGQFPTTLDWAAAIIFSVLGWALALTIFGKYKSRIPYWL